MVVEYQVQFSPRRSRQWFHMFGEDGIVRYGQLVKAKRVLGFLRENGTARYRLLKVTTVEKAMSL